MTAKRVYFLNIAGLIISLLLLVALAVGTGKIIQKQGTKLSDLRAQNTVMQEQQTALIQAKKDLEKYAELNKIARSIVPQDKDQAKTVREITKIAEESGIQLKTIAFSSSTLGQAGAKPAQGQPATAGGRGQPGPRRGTGR